MVFDMNNTDTLSNLFGNLSLDIQEKIYGEVLYNQEVKKTKDKYKKVMYELQEVMYKSFDYKKELNSEEYYEFRYDINSMNYNLYDFCDCDIGEYDSMLEEILEDNFNTTTNEELKSLLYMCSMRKLFYGKLDKYEDIILF